jgi:hypothetical protein
MDKWVQQLCEALDVPREAVDVQALLDLARDAAHHVERPAAPVTTYLVGFAAARRGGDRTTIAELIRQSGELARRWGTSTPD